MQCDRCKRDLAFIKPLNTCNVVQMGTYSWTTYTLCDECVEELFKFLGEKQTNRFQSEEFRYLSSALNSNLNGSGTDEKE